MVKNGRKVKATALLFIFGYFFKNEKWAKNGRKIKELALLFCHFFTPFFKIEKSWYKYTKCQWVEKAVFHDIFRQTVNQNLVGSILGSLIFKL